jgi:hypothetical protein
MLIYTNHLTLEPENGASSVLTLLADWLSWKTKERIEPAMLLSDGAEHAYRDQGVLRTELCPAAEGAFGFKADYSHVDFKIPTRRWSTEVEIRQAENDLYVECSVSVSVQDRPGFKARKPFSSRPRLVVDIVEACRPVGTTPGLFTKELTLDTCEKFLNEANRLGRKIPLVVFSCKFDGEPIIEADRLREQLLGLAELYFIPPQTDTVDLAAAVGEKMMTYDGAARILWPVTGTDEAIPSMFVLPYNADGSTRPRQDMETLIFQKIMLSNAKAKAALKLSNQLQ